ncbi:MAG: zinc ABC transporter substrate-binding protein [Candidatus Delongbacteria bacterium]
MRRAAWWLGLLWLAWTGCAPGRDGDDGRLRVVCTTGMITDLATRVGGGQIVCQGLMGPGVDPHLYKATAGDVERLSRADLVLYNGLHLEARLAEVFAHLPGARSAALGERLPGAAPLLGPDGHAPDPHIWFDVSLWSLVARRIGEELAAADSANAAGYRARAAALGDSLLALHAEILTRVSQLPPERRLLVTAHDAFQYFGRAYGFEVRGLQGISTAAEAGARDVQALATLLVERRVPAIFVESSVPRRTLEAVLEAARARGAHVRLGGELFSDALGDGGTPEGTYAGMVRHNVDTILGALEEQP